MGKLSKTWQATFLSHLATDACVSYACSAAGVSRDHAYDHRKADPAFAAAWEAALECSTERLEQEATRRACDGSDTLLIFLLKARRPGVYRDRVSIDIDDQIRSLLGDLGAGGETPAAEGA